MRSQLKTSAHLTVPNEQVIEVWHDGKLIATVTGTEGPGVRVISKYPMDAHIIDGCPAGTPGVCEVRVKPN
jgi:hypothetical protein